MKKKIFIAMLLILIICSGSAFADLNDALNKLDEIESNIVIALMPFDGANGVNMRDTRYPLRANVVTSGNNPVSTDELEFDEGTSLNSYKGATTSNTYNNQQMIILGGVEGVPTNGCQFHDEYTGSIFNRTYYYYRIVYTGDTAPVSIDFNSSTDFMYVSQSNPIYRRPYAVHVARRYALSNNQTTISGKHTSDPFITLDNDNYYEGAELEMHQDGGNFTSSWFDLVLALPYDSVNSITETGVTYKNIEYPLNDTKDYSSVLTVSLSWTQQYKVQMKIDDGEWSDTGYKGTFHRSMSMAVPFSGFSSTIETGPSDATASLTISLFPAASNLSLNDADTNREVKVAELDFIMNLPNYTLKDGKRYTTGTLFESNDGPVYVEVAEDKNSNIWLFLSASPDPYNDNLNGFVLVHENAGNMLTSYNSANYEVIVKGIGDNAGQEDVFDGYAKASDFTIAGGSEDGYIHTYCNAIEGSNNYLLHQRGTYSPNNQYWWRLDSYDSYIYNHYHSYRGEVYVKIEPTALKPEGMRAGRYTSEIYVHVMTSD